MSGLFGDGHRQAYRKSVEWYTPAWVFDELGLHFDLDPCSPHDMESHVPADVKHTIFDDGLARPWNGRVWLNPPYGPETADWMRRMIEHRNGVALTFSRTDAVWCQECMQSAEAILFLSGRIAFVPGLENQHKTSRAGAGSVMFAWGSRCAEALSKLAHRGSFIDARGVARRRPRLVVANVGIQRASLE